MLNFIPVVLLHIFLKNPSFKSRKFRVKNVRGR